MGRGQSCHFESILGFCGLELVNRLAAARLALALPSCDRLRDVVSGGGVRASRLAAAPPPAYAWASFDGSTLIESGASGLADGLGAGADDRRSGRIASVTSVVALGVMRIVEQGGSISIGRFRYFGIGCAIPFSGPPITLRLLLSHRSSLRDEIDYAIPSARRFATRSPSRRFDARTRRAILPLFEPHFP